MSGYSEEVEALRARVAAGNEKLVKSWLQIEKITKDDPLLASQINSHTDAAKKLRGLCIQLELLGYHDCLWEGKPHPELWENRDGCEAWKDGMWCWACPVTSEQIWNQRIASGKHAWVYHRDLGNDVIEFLKLLGEEI